MSVKLNTTDDHFDAQPRTLGTVLYANQAREPQREEDWAKLVGSIAGGDQLALHALYERAHRIVFTLAMRITNNQQTAEELTLDVFHDAWRNASRYDPADGTVLGWLLNQTRSRAIDRMRFDGRHKRSSSSDEDWRDWTPPRDSEDALAVRERAQLLRKALSTLTPDEHRAIEAAYLSEQTYSEVAAQLKEPLGTIKTRIRSGLAKLRDALAGTGRP
jgi:RNA polymerase sigma-70 factor (ECF subfamily)